MFLDKIPDLAEHFIYGNDDMYILNKLTPEDFFDTKGNPKVSMREIAIDNSASQFNKVCWNNYHHIAKKLGIIKKEQWFKRPIHSIIPYRKQTCIRVLDLMQNDIYRNLSAFRTDLQHNQYIYACYEELTGNLKKSFINFVYMSTNKDVNSITETIGNPNIQIFCLNNVVVANVEQWHKNIKLITEAFDKKFTDKSYFEK